VRSRTSPSVALYFGPSGPRLKAGKRARSDLVPTRFEVPANWISSVPCLQPAPQRDHGPDCLHKPKRPSPLQKAIGRAEQAGASESKDVPGAPGFQSVSDKHQGDGEQAEQGQGIIAVSFVHFLQAAVAPPSLCLGDAAEGRRQRAERGK